MDTIMVGTLKVVTGPKSTVPLKAVRLSITSCTYMYNMTIGPGDVFFH